MGHWRATVGQLPQQINGTSVTLTGCGGTVLVFNPDGSYSGDFSRTQPYTATTGHQRVSLVVTGRASGTFLALASSLSLVSTHTTLLVTVRVDGKVTSQVHPTNTSSAGYTCAKGRLLTLSAGSFATKYVPAG